jgi:hypothetical protein
MDFCSLLTYGTQEYLMRLSKGFRRALDLDAIKHRIGFKSPVIGESRANLAQ